MGAVRICQLDGSLPNLALMALSHWHRTRGDDVRLFRGADAVERKLDEPDYDRVYASAIFKFSAPLIEQFQAQWPEAIIGGTGSGNLQTVEQVIGDEPGGLDYTPWPEYRNSIGFTQRGCRLSCKFCVVPTKEGKPRSVNTIRDIWRGEPFPKNIHLLDNDFFGAPGWQDRIAEIRDGGFKVCFNQGINVRAMTDEAAAAIALIQYRDDSFKTPRLYTAWDNLKDEEVFFKGIDLLERHGVPASHILAYMLVGFDKRETWERILHRHSRMKERGVWPYPMVFDCRATDPERYHELRRFARWAIRVDRRFSIPWQEYNASAKSGAGPDDRQLSLLPAACLG